PRCLGTSDRVCSRDGILPRLLYCGDGILATTLCCSDRIAPHLLNPGDRILSRPLNCCNRILTRTLGRSDRILIDRRRGCWLCRPPRSAPAGDLAGGAPEPVGVCSSDSKEVGLTSGVPASSR